MFIDLARRGLLIAYVKIKFLLEINVTELKTLHLLIDGNSWSNFMCLILWRFLNST